MSDTHIHTNIHTHTHTHTQKRCRHAFCRDCAKKAGGICPKCKEGDQVFEEASMGNVYICTHGGGRLVSTMYPPTSQFFVLDDISVEKPVS